MNIKDLFEQPVLRPAPRPPVTPAPIPPSRPGEVVRFPGGVQQPVIRPPRQPGRAPGEIMSEPNAGELRPSIRDLMPSRDIFDPLKPSIDILPRPPTERGTGPTLPIKPKLSAPSTPELQPERRPVTAPSTPELQPERRPVTAPSTPELQPERRPVTTPSTPVTRPTKDDPYNPEPVITPQASPAAASTTRGFSVTPTSPPVSTTATASSPPPVPPPRGEKLAAPPPTLPSTDVQTSQLSTVSKPPPPRTAAPSRDTSVQQLSPPGVSDDSRINAMKYLAGLKASGRGETLNPPLGLNPDAWQPQLRSGFQQQTGRSIAEFPPSGRETEVRESLNRLAQLAGLVKN